MRIGYLTQQVAALRGQQRVLEAVQQIRRSTSLASGKELSATTLLEDFGFRGDLLSSQLDDLSGGERRRLQVLGYSSMNPTCCCWTSRPMISISTP